MATTATPLPSATASAISITLTGTGTGSAETIFTPPTGYKWRLIGWDIRSGIDAIGSIQLLEAAVVIRSGATSTGAAAVFASSSWTTPLGHIPHESAVNAVLRILATSAEEISGTVFIQVFPG
jgi:hypothetical protein